MNPMTPLLYDLAEFYASEKTATTLCADAIRQLPDNKWKPTIIFTWKEPKSWTFVLTSLDNYMHIQPSKHGVGYLAKINRSGDQLVSGPFEHPGEAAMACGVKLRNEVQVGVRFLEKVCDELEGLEDLEEEVEACLKRLKEDSHPDNELFSENG